MNEAREYWRLAHQRAVAVGRSKGLLPRDHSHEEYVRFLDSHTGYKLMGKLRQELGEPPDDPPEYPL